MKFPGSQTNSSPDRSATPDVTARVMAGLGFTGVDVTPESLKSARISHLFRRSIIFLTLASLVVCAALLEKGISREDRLGSSVRTERSEASQKAGLNPISALQAPFKRINLSLSAAEAGESPAAVLPGESDDDSAEKAPLQGPILVPGSFGDACASLASS